jgi:hypothetical protein
MSWKAFSFVVFLSLLSAPASAQTTVEWEVLHRFRLITDERHEALFLRKVLGGGGRGPLWSPSD